MLDYMGVCCNLVARSVPKTDVLTDVWAHIPPRLPGVDVCAIVSVPKKSKEVGFAGLARKPAIYGSKGS